MLRKKLVKLSFKLLFTTGMLYDFSGSTIPTVLEVCPASLRGIQGSFGVVSSPSPGRQNWFWWGMWKPSQTRKPPGFRPFQSAMSGTWQNDQPPGNPWSQRREFTHCVQDAWAGAILKGLVSFLRVNKKAQLLRKTTIRRGILLAIKLLPWTHVPEENSQIGPNAWMSLFSATEICSRQWRAINTQPHGNSFYTNCT